ncbi:GH39 family glycosyl hydrolase [Cohnella zeiphila]|uniref:Glycosyl hydrolases family 39 N-terminal catalytic domain-containing protein n=1 Tax=Cohnella zeiphila TaxID=2761120 RepID=A0A7X0SQC7_9BACL|nr:hypothetical protein [Cohnella zeiphila]MBB6734036.1 hypothetical protein [Cohnella zeiphila]
MRNRFDKLPVQEIQINAAVKQGQLELWRHSIGHGGINSLPLPDRVVQGSKKLKPRLLRTFIQDYFNIYPEHGKFDWHKLDPYMNSLSATGAKVVAAITIKPRVLYPDIDHTVWMPNDVDEWRNVIRELVKRYSVEKQIVTYWEIGNETDIGEWGGSPYYIKNPDDYVQYYEMTAKAVLEAFPEAKVGGPAVTDGDRAIIPALVDYCGRTGLQLDFVSFHAYTDDLEYHKDQIREYQEVVKRYPGKRPELLYTEFNKSFDPVSLEDMAFDPRRSSIVAAILIDFVDIGLDWSFYYHVWDQANYKQEFEKFFNDPYIMIKHWNEIPHRFGLFGVGEEVRPQYFVYRMLQRMGAERIEARTDHPHLKVLASEDDRRKTVFFVNHHEESRDMIVTLRFSDLAEGPKRLKVYRIDENQRWLPQELELVQVESRETDVLTNFFCQVYCPADSVLLTILEDSDVKL